MILKLFLTKLKYLNSVKIHFMMVKMRRPPCEWRIRDVLPLIRASISSILLNEYGFSIYQAAKVLEVTPAAVSNYKSAKRSKAELVKKLLNDRRFRRELDKWVGMLIKGEVEAGDVICILCRRLSRFEDLIKE